MISALASKALIWTLNNTWEVSHTLKHALKEVLPLYADWTCFAHWVLLFISLIVLELLTGKRKVGLGEGALFCLHVFKLKLDKRLFSLRKINPAERSIEPQAARRKIHYLPTFLLPLFAKDSSLGNQGINLLTISSFWIRHNFAHGKGPLLWRHIDIKRDRKLFCIAPYPDPGTTLPFWIPLQVGQQGGFCS